MKHARQLTPYERTQLARYAPQLDVATLTDETPIEYSTGKVEFCDLVFAITPEALIPRIETEELVHRAAREIDNMLRGDLTDGQLVVADVGTGCGAVLLTLAHQFRQHKDAIRWLGSDVSATAVQLAQENAKSIATNVELFVSDLLADYPANLMFDLMIANLPYIPHDRIAFLDKSVNAHEPHLALDGGSDGLRLIDAFLRQATPRVRSHGVVLLEIDYTHTLDVFNQFRPDWLINVETDTFTRNRFARLEHK